MKRNLKKSALTVLLLLAVLLCGCKKEQKDAYSVAHDLIGSSVTALTDEIGQPNKTAFASSCLGDGEDGEYYYDGFTVYTYRDVNGGETIYDVIKEQ